MRAIELKKKEHRPDILLKNDRLNKLHFRDLNRRFSDHWTFKYLRTANQKPVSHFSIPIGLHSWPIIVGIVGLKKLLCDIWCGTASRMESHGQVGKLNISEKTYALTKHHPDFLFESRGSIEAKGKGALEMYFVDQKRETN